MVKKDNKSLVIVFIDGEIREDGDGEMKIIGDEEKTAVVPDHWIRQVAD